MLKTALGAWSEHWSTRQSCTSPRVRSLPTQSQSLDKSITGEWPAKLFLVAVVYARLLHLRGLVHKSLVHADSDEGDSPEETEANSYTAAQSGQLTGMAQDQNTHVVPVDVEARREQAAARSVTAREPLAQEEAQQRERGGRGGRVQGSVRRLQSEAAANPRGRHLRDIVRDSTERWLMPTVDADREYYEELRAMGYQVEEAEVHRLL